MGSVALFGMYLVVKYLGKEWINIILGWYVTCYNGLRGADRSRGRYFAFTGVASVWKVQAALIPPSHAF
jgi:hypothetical protein